MLGAGSELPELPELLDPLDPPPVPFEPDEEPPLEPSELFVNEAKPPVNHKINKTVIIVIARIMTMV